MAGASRCMCIFIAHSPHVEVVCQLVRQSMNNDKQKNYVKKENLKNVKVKVEARKRINYREEEISNCGCIDG